KNSDVKSVIVEPEGSTISGGKPGKHTTEGIGRDFFANLFHLSLIDDVYTLFDKHALNMVNQMTIKDDFMFISSSVAAMYAALQEEKRTHADATIVTIFPDGSDRYLSKNIY